MKWLLPKFNVSLCSFMSWTILLAQRCGVLCNGQRVLLCAAKMHWSVASCMYINMLQCYAVVSVMLWCVMRWSVYSIAAPQPLQAPQGISLCSTRLHCSRMNFNAISPCALCFAVCGHNSSVRLVLCLAGLAVGVQCAVIFAQCPVWCRILYLVFSAVLSV